MVVVVAAAVVVVVVVVVTLVGVVKMSSGGRFLFDESQDHKTAIICVNSDSYIIIFLILALNLTSVFVLWLSTVALLCWRQWQVYQG